MYKKRIWQPWFAVTLVVLLMVTAVLTRTSFAQQATSPNSPAGTSPADYAENVEFTGLIGGDTVMTFQGHLAYVSVGPRLTILDVTDPVSPTKISETFFLPSLGKVLVEGDYAYFTERGWLRIIDVSDPAHPAEIGFYEGGGWNSYFAVTGNHVFVIDRYLWDPYDYTVVLRAIDVSDPANPKAVGAVDLGPYARIDGIFTDGDFLYVLNPYGYSVYDISDPTSMARIGGCCVGTLMYYAQEIRVVGDRTYLRGHEEVWIIDSSDPEHHIKIGDFGAYPVGLDVVGEIAFLTSIDGLHIFDLSDPADPQELGFFDTIGIGGPVSVHDGYAYVGDYAEGVHIVDVADLSSPQAVGLYQSPGGAELAVSNGFAYLARNNGIETEVRLHIIDARDESNPTLVSSTDIQLVDYPSHGCCATYPDEMVAADEFLYLSYLNRLAIIDVSNPSAPNLVGILETANTIYDMVVDGTNAYCADYHDGLHIIDLSDPANPEEIGYVAIPGARDVAVVGRIAYVPSVKGVHILDISKPSNPLEIGVFPITSEIDPDQIAVSANRAYVYDRYDTDILLILDLSDPANPQELATMPFGYWVRGFAADGNILYVTSRPAYPDYFYPQLRIIDTSDPNNSRELGHFEWIGQQLFLDNGTIYFMDSYDIYMLAPEKELVASPPQIELWGTPGSTLQTTITVSETVGIQAIAGVTISASDLTAAGAKTIPASSISFEPPAFDLAAGTSQQISATITLPASLRSGDYQGSIHVESPAEERASIPITVYARRGQGAFPPPQWRWATQCDKAQPSRRTLWPADGRMVKVKIVGAGKPRELVIDGIWQDEDVGAEADGVIEGNQVWLRAKRAEDGDGRVYHVAFSASYRDGTSCAHKVLVTVPLHRGAAGGVHDDGPLANSTLP